MPIRAGISGVGILLTASLVILKYIVGESGQEFRYKETTTSFSRIWTGITEAGAKQKVNENEQPSDAPQGTFTWSCQIENPIIKSYQVQVVYQKTVTVRE
jgi:hypothetical protein